MIVNNRARVCPKEVSVLPYKSTALLRGGPFPTIENFNKVHSAIEPSLWIYCVTDQVLNFRTVLKQCFSNFTMTRVKIFQAIFSQKKVDRFLYIPYPRQ